MTRLDATLALLTTAGLAFLVGCTSLPEDIAAPNQAEIAAVLATDGVHLQELDMLAVTPQMKDYVHRVLPTGGSPRHRVRALLYSLGQPGLMSVEYDADANLTADEAFVRRRANCLSFSALFVALAREAGFTAQFQEVDVPPRWAPADNDILVRSQHVNTLISLPRRRDFIGEFRDDLFDVSMPRRAVSDDYALALLYNNLGAQHLFNDDVATARSYFVHALRIEPKVAIAWVNLGVAHRRNGRLDLAEIAYRQALAVDREKEIALNNLALLYESTGRTAAADALRSRAEKLRELSPHYHYALAQRAYHNLDFVEARAHIENALRRDGGEHQFHHLMALIMRAQGDFEEARTRMRLAEKHASSESDKQAYRAEMAAWAEAERKPM